MKADLIHTDPGATLPPCTQFHAGKFLLKRGTSGSDSLYVGFRTAPATFAWALLMASGEDAVVNGLEVNGSVGFYGTTPISKPAVTGSRGSNAALASLCTALANLGLITDSTS